MPSPTTTAGRPSSCPTGSRTLELPVDLRAHEGRPRATGPKARSRTLPIDDPMIEGMYELVAGRAADRGGRGGRSRRRWPTGSACTPATRLRLERPDAGRARGGRRGRAIDVPALRGARAARLTSTTIDGGWRTSVAVEHARRPARRSDRAGAGRRCSGANGDRLHPPGGVRRRLLRRGRRPTSRCGGASCSAPWCSWSSPS